MPSKGGNKELTPSLVNFFYENVVEKCIFMSHLEYTHKNIDMCFVAKYLIILHKMLYIYNDYEGDSEGVHTFVPVCGRYKIT